MWSCHWEEKRLGEPCQQEIEMFWGQGLISSQRSQGLLQGEGGHWLTMPIWEEFTLIEISRSNLTLTFYFLILLKYNWFTMCSFLLHSKVTLIYIYIYICSFSYFFYYDLSQNIEYGLPRWFSGKESTCNAGDTRSIPGSGRAPGEGQGSLTLLPWVSVFSVQLWDYPSVYIHLIIKRYLGMNVNTDLAFISKVW